MSPQKGECKNRRNEKRMRKIMPLCASIALILMAGMFASAGSMAYFSDTETVSVGDFSAGTLDLTVDDQNPCTIHIELHDIKPGQKQRYWWVLKNVGTITGQPYVTFSPIINKENDRIEPEIEAGDPTPNVGELGQYLTVWIGQQDPALRGTDIYNYDRKGVLNNLDPNICYGKPPEGGRDVNSPAKIGNPSRFGGMYFQELGPGDEVVFLMEISLPSDVGNIVQSDSVEFDITFHLDQA